MDTIIYWSTLTHPLMSISINLKFGCQNTRSVLFLLSVSRFIDTLTTPIAVAWYLKSMACCAIQTMRTAAIALISTGLEFCYTVMYVYISPLLLQLDLPVYLMTMTWAIGPVVGMIVTPVFGALSDSKLDLVPCIGRRGLFTLIYSAGIVCGIILVAYGKTLGEFLGDSVITSPSNITAVSNISPTNVTYNACLFAKDMGSSQACHNNNYQNHLWDKYWRLMRPLMQSHHGYFFSWINITKLLGFTAKWGQMTQNQFSGN